jgi:glycosyltransferase involved in cell wall biosynthesis
VEAHDSSAVAGREEAQRQGLAHLVSLSRPYPAAVPPPRLPLELPVTALPRQHRHRAAGERHATRFGAFGVIGAAVFLAGLAGQVALVRVLRWDAVAAYAVAGVASVQLSFLLNRYLTWRDRDVRFVGALWRWNTQKAAVTAVNMAAYAVLVRLGVQYVVANVALTAVFTPVNYVLGHYWSFRRRTPMAPPAASAEAGAATAGPRLAETAVDLVLLPSVSAVIPCKNSQATIAATVRALLGQDYGCLDEVIVVGDYNDPTYAALQDIGDPRLIIIEQEATPGRRDPNVKRDKGIRKSSGDIVALVDSDIVMDPGWLTAAVRRLQGQGGGLVAGGMRSIHDTFWGRFVDRNALAAKTPRLARPYQVTVANFGRRGCKPPITANAVFTRDMYEACPLDVTWAYGYEDYEWFWRLAKGGQRIMFTGELTAAHHHRRSFRGLWREYRQAAHGCAYYCKVHPDSPLARKRRLQAFGLPVAAVLGFAAFVLAARMGYAVAAAGVLVAVAAVLAGREVVRARSVEAVAYPVAGLALGLVFTGSLLTSYGRLAVAGPEIPAPGDDEREPSLLRRIGARISWPLTAILALQAALSGSLIAGSGSPFGDEALYIWAGHLELAHWLHGAALTPIGPSASFRFYFSGAPQLYPPLGALADAAGHLPAARALSLAAALGATVLLYLVTVRLVGKIAACVAIGVWAVSEPCLKVGAFATYDAMAVFLVCLGTWVAVQAGTRRHRGELIALAAAILALGSIVAYSYLIYIPAIITICALAWVPRMGRRAAVVSAAWLTGATGFFYLVAATSLKLWPGIFFTVLNRHVNFRQGYLLIANSAWSWQGLAMCLAMVGMIVAISRKQQAWLVTVFAMTCLLVPLQQGRLQTGVSLDKHLAFGVWCAAVAAGYGVSYLLSARMGHRALLACAAFALAVPAITGWTAAWWGFQGWYNTAAVTAVFNRFASETPGKFAIEGQSIAPLRYSTAEGHNWVTWSERWGGVGLPSILGTQTAAQKTAAIKQYQAVLHSQGYGLVLAVFSSPNVLSLTQAALNPAAGSSADALNRKVAGLLTNNSELATLVTALRSDPHYRIVAIVPYGHNLGNISAAAVIWKRVGGTR